MYRTLSADPLIHHSCSTVNTINPSNCVMLTLGFVHFSHWLPVARALWGWHHGVSGCPLWLRFPGGRGRGGGLSADLESRSMLWIDTLPPSTPSPPSLPPPPAQTHTYTVGWPLCHLALSSEFCYWLGYDVLTDEADVCSPFVDSLSVLFSKLKSSGISWVKTIILASRQRGYMVCKLQEACDVN